MGDGVNKSKDKKKVNKDKIKSPEKVRLLMLCHTLEFISYPLSLTSLA